MAAIPYKMFTHKRIQKMLERYKRFRDRNGILSSLVCKGNVAAFERAERVDGAV